MGKKVLALSGSPRKGGDSDTLCDRFLKGAAVAGHGLGCAFMVTGRAAKITNLGALKIVPGAKHFALYLLFTSIFALAAGITVNSLL